MKLARVAQACPTLLRAGAPALGQARGLLTTTPALKLETQTQTATAEGVQQPLAEGDALAKKRNIKESYEDVLKERSGTAHDVRVVDEAQTSLGKMTKDPRAVEQDYSQGARQDVVSHGGSERFSEDEGIADAVFDQTRSDKGYDDNANATQPWDATFAKKPTDS